ncbi:MAG: hypothetical protein KA974_04975 [Saprospiraceae bacterium]|nr:hypothetical protein [Saprospiraceae bacterium]MBP7699140.1 hypothetical protein [Saprospiraceae bacterium]
MRTLSLHVCLFACLNFFQPKTSAQTAPNLPTDIPWDADVNTAGNQPLYNTKYDVEAAYNNARRGEEVQLSLPPNSLGNLTLPNDWTTRSEDYRAFMLLNAERSCRMGINYPTDAFGVVQTYPYNSIEVNLDAISDSHALWCVANNVFQHNGANGITPFQRIANDPVIGSSCSEFINRAENIAIFGTSGTTNKMIIERAIYNWIYANKLSGYVHRETVLLANMTVSGNTFSGYSDNYAETNIEGFIGIASAGASASVYNPLGWVGMNRVDIVVFNIMDPASFTSCNYNIFNPLGVVSTPAPVTLNHFSGKQSFKNIELTWDTKSELNNDYFTLEHSNDGYNYERIAIIQGAGTSSQSKYYATIDSEPYLGANYYRLSQTDYDGTKVNISTITVQYLDEPVTSIYPNPLMKGNAVNISFQSNSNEPVVLSITNEVGLMVIQQQFDVREGNNNLSLSDISTQLSGGYYIVSTKQENSKPQNISLVIVE